MVKSISLKISGDVKTDVQSDYILTVSVIIIKPIKHGDPGQDVSICRNDRCSPQIFQSTNQGLLLIISCSNIIYSGLPT